MDFKKKIDTIIDYFLNLCDVCDQFESAGIWNEETSLRRVFALELVVFKMYLLSSDKSEEFKEKIPTIFSVACEFERVCYENGVNPKKTTLVEQFLVLYRLTGELIIEMDCGISDEEQEDLNRYLNKIEQFIKSYY